MFVQSQETRKRTIVLGDSIVPTSPNSIAWVDVENVRNCHVEGNKPMGRTISLRNSILLMSFFSVVSVALVSVVPSYTFGFSSVEDVSDQLQTQTVERIRKEIQASLDVPHEILRNFESTLFHIDLDENGIKCDNVPARLMNFGVIEKSTFMSQSWFGIEDGSVFGVVKERGPISILCAAPETNFDLKDAHVTNKTILTPFKDLKIRNSVPKFDTTLRPWYKAAKTKKAPTWSPVYRLVATGGRILSLGAVRPIYKDLNEEKFVGVALAGMNLALVEEKLQSIQTSENGFAYILQENGTIIANTMGVNTTNRDNLMVFYDDSGNELMINSANELKRKSDGGFSIIHGIRKYSTFKGDTEYLTFATTIIDPRGGLEWTVVILIPRSDMFSKVDHMITLSSSLTAALFVLTLSITMVASTYISRPLNVVADAMQNISKLNFDNRDSRKSESNLKEIRMIQSSFQVMDSALQSFGKFVPLAVVKRIMSNSNFANDLYVERKNLTIMFTDLKGFTSLSESLPTDALLNLISDYFEMMVSLVSQSDGVICDFIGDGIMSFWNSPVSVENHEALAIKTALLQLEALKKLNDNWISNGYIREGLGMRIGIHTGEVLVGNIGSTNRMKYGAVGDAVNIASRLEGLNKRYGSEIIISDVTHEHVKELFFCRPLETVVVKGRIGSIKIHEVMESVDADMTDDRRSFNVKKKEILESAQDIHLKTKETKSIVIDQLRDYVCHNDDPPAYRILEIISSPFYDGVSILDTK